MKKWKADATRLIHICECQPFVTVSHAVTLLPYISGNREMLVFCWLAEEICYYDSHCMTCLFAVSNKQQEINQHAHHFVIRKVSEGWL
jgi:hypothetical protein